MKRKWIFAGGIAVVLTLMVTGYLMRPQNPSSAGEEGKSIHTASIYVNVITLGDSPDTTYVDTTGTVRAEFEAPIAARMMGRILSVNVVEGERVRRGQPLVTIDARDLDAGVAQANASVRTAATGYDSARVAARMEDSMSGARIAEAEAGISLADAAFKAAQAKLDQVQSGPRKQERMQASLVVIQAKAAYDLAQENLKRMETLVQQGAISRQQYDTTKSQLDVAKAQYDASLQSQSMTDEGSRAEEIRAAQEAVRQAQAAQSQSRAELRKAQAMVMQVAVRKQDIRGAQAQLNQVRASRQLAEVTRDYAAIVAPFDGIIAQRIADPGAMASPGTPLLKVQGGRTRLEAIVPESMLSHVRVGDRIPVSLDALGGKSMSGVVGQIAPQGDSASHTFLVKINLPMESSARAGMFGRARFRVGASRKLIIPQTSVTEREGLRYVYVIDDNSVARMRLITIGDEQNGRVQVLSGLNAGERIVTSPTEEITDGATVSTKRL